MTTPSWSVVGSARGFSAVDRDDLTGDERRGIGGQEENRLCDLVRLANTAERHTGRKRHLAFRGAGEGRGALYLMLQNRIYRGEITHKGKSYPGEHPAIIDQPLWDEVQAGSCPKPGRAGNWHAHKVPESPERPCVRRERRAPDANLCDQEGNALPILCLFVSCERSNREPCRRVAPTGRRSRRIGNRHASQPFCRSRSASRCGRH